MHLSDLIPEYKGTAISISGIATDSRKIRKGDLFVAIKGNALDGHEYIDKAIAKGAAAVVAEPSCKVKSAKIPIIKAKDTRSVAADLASKFYPAQPEMIVAVTGTNGKTSTAEFLRQIWSNIGWQSVSIGTLGVIDSKGNTITGEDTLTTPDAVTLHQLLHRLAIEQVSHVAMEASSHGIAQQRLAGVKINIASFTNLSHDHLDYHPSIEDYFAAKAQLFTEILEEGGSAIINTDSEWGMKLKKMLKKRVLRIITVGQNKEADLFIKSITPFESGLEVSLTYQKQNFVIPLALSGAFQVTNAVLAAAIAHASGLAMEHALMQLAYIRSVPGRMQTIHGHPQGAIVVVDYAHTPDALATALSSLRQTTKGKLGVVFGCGGDRDQAKRPEMGKIAARLADFAIVTDDNPRSEDPAQIRAEIRKSCPKASEIGDRHQAIAEGLKQIKNGDVLLIAGKGHEDSQTIGSETLPFSDEAAVRGILTLLASSKTKQKKGAA